MPWLFAEDEALKRMLQGMYVTDPNSGPQGRKVPVKFMMPEDEVSNLTFPCVVIRHLPMYLATDRIHDGYITIPYAPEGYATWWYDSGPATTEFDPADSPYRSWFPTPYNFDYQITVYGRNMHLHILPIVSQLAQYGRLHARFPYLDIPEDGTKRTCILQAGPEYNYTFDNNNKKMMTVDYNFRVFSELLAPIDQPNPVLTVNFNLDADFSVYGTFQDIPDNDKSSAIIATTGEFGWNTEALNR